MDPYLVAQIEAGNHARMQQAHMYSDAANYESARQAHMQEAQSAARSRSQRQGQQQHETIPESSNDDRRSTRSTTTQRDAPAAAAAEPEAEDMRAKLARINVMSGKQQRGKSSRREEAESSHRVRESSSHRLIVFQREFESSWVRRHEPSLYSRRSCESESPYREGEIYYRTRRTAPSTAGGSSSGRQDRYYRLSGVQRGRGGPALPSST